jgi:isoleucyl-tRNA synthetase
MHVLAVALFDRPAFKNCLAHGILLGDDGQKMSKRLRNYPDPEAMFDEHGSDAMRWFLLSSPIMRGGDMIADEKGIREAVRSALLPLWNAWYFFSLYANADGRRAALGRVSSPSLLDRYILASLSSVVADVTEAMEGYDLSGACSALEGFLDRLTNWYIRRSRDRFWGTSAEEGGETDTQAAFDTLGTVLEVLCRLAAPLLPLIAEAVWTGLTGGDSVHLAAWPGGPAAGAGEAARLPADPGLVTRMDLVREMSGRSARRPTPSARRTGCGPACRSSPCWWPGRTPPRSGSSPTSSPTR